jgi:oligoribonuclease NrnB/cAMP/cGMP phosphodiesterase (DHH superfamily)
MDIIYHHAHCPDGWCAAYVASKRYPEAEIIGLDHGVEFDYTPVYGKEVLMLDFSLPTREANDRLCSLTKYFHIFDHHKSAREVLDGAPYAVFDMKRSGAGLTWDYLFGKDCSEACYDQGTSWEPRPWYVDYTEDQDLWNWKLPKGREVCAYVRTLPFTKKAWDTLEEMTTAEACTKGEGSLAYIKHYVDEVTQQAQVGMLGDYKTAILNVPYLGCSEVGEKLAKVFEVSLTYYEDGQGIYRFSLRSNKDGYNIDVSEIAKKYGGGGHRNAAGFQLPAGNGRKLVDEILGRKVYEPIWESRSRGGCV